MAEKLRSKLNAHRVALIVSAGAVLALLLLAVGAWAYDASQDDQIAPGVTIAGADVGDMSVDQAREVVEREVVAPLSRPVVVVFGGKDYELDPKTLDQSADVEGMLDEAVEVSREGGIVDRLGRYVTGSEVHEDIAARIAYSQEAVDRFVGRLAEKLDRDPVDASLIPSTDSLSPASGRDGIELQQDKVADQIAEKLESGDGGRAVKAVVERTRPEVTRQDLAARYPSYITIDRSGYKLRLFENLALTKTYPIAVGQAGLETPAGLYSIQNKQVNPYWYVPDSDWAGDLAGTVVPPGPDNPLQARWMGIYAGAGIHGTSDLASLGTAASHGCIRMAIPDVIELFDQVEIGTPVYIQ